MQGNDIGVSHGKRMVVILEDGIYIRNDRVLSFPQFRSWERKAREFDISELVCKWINQMGYLHSIHTEVWSFLPQALFEILVPRVQRMCDENLSAWLCWESPHEANVYLRSSPDIYCVYDSDNERVEMVWQMRGARIDSRSPSL